MFRTFGQRCRVEAIAALNALWLTNCGADLPVAQRAEYARIALVEVGRRPPPALPELIPAAPRAEGAVWADGCWQWSVGRWVWVRGGWVAPPENASYFAGETFVNSLGRILIRPCAWVVEGERVEPPRVLAPALFPEAERTVEELYR